MIACLAHHFLFAVTVVPVAPRTSSVNLLRHKTNKQIGGHTFSNLPYLHHLVMDFAQTRVARRRRAAELSARKERKIRFFCSGVAVLMFIFAASAFLLRWFTESPPLMPQ